MSLFSRNEERQEKHSHPQQQQAASNTVDFERPGESRVGAATVQMMERREQQRREEQWREEQEARRAAERHAAATLREPADAKHPQPQTQTPRHPEPDIEDAVVRRERSAAGDMPVTDNNDRRKQAPLFSAAAAQDFRARWDAMQIGFVDDPRRAVRQADELVTQVMHSLGQTFASERKQLEAHMGETASTENLRVALQRYRSFFQRLLTL